MDIRTWFRGVRDAYASNRNTWHLVVVFAAVYFAEGIAQQSGIIGQPLRLYLNDGLKLNTTQIALLGWIWYIPVLVKPLLGILTDYVPILGSRRKLYLIGANAVATIGYLVMIGAFNVITLSVAMFITNAGLIMATAVCGGLLVEQGQKSGLSSKLVSLQWVFFSIALIFSSSMGGMLSEQYKAAPVIALHYAGGIAAVAIVLITVVCWYFVNEEKSAEKANWLAVGATIKDGVAEVAKTKAVWLAGLFIFSYFFSPGFGNPMFLYMKDSLHFDQQFIGNLGSLGSIASIAGGVVYLFMSRWMSLRSILYFSMIAGILATLSTFLLVDRESAVILTLGGSAVGMIALIAGCTLAAEFCPKGAESFTYAILMSCHNLCNPVSELSGGLLYDTYSTIRV